MIVHTHDLMTDEGDWCLEHVHNFTDEGHKHTSEDVEQAFKTLLHGAHMLKLSAHTLEELWQNMVDRLTDELY